MKEKGKAMRCTSVVMGIITAVFASPVAANLIEFTFGGTVSAYCDIDGGWGGGFSSSAVGGLATPHGLSLTTVGDAFELVYVFDTSAPGGTLSDGTASFAGALVGMHVTVGSTEFVYESFTRNEIIVNDSPSFDQYQVFAEGKSSSGTFLNTRVNLGDPTGMAFNSGELPQTLDPMGLGNLSLFENQAFFLFPDSLGDPDGDRIEAVVDSFSATVVPVPVPGGALLGLLGLGGVGWVRRRIS